MLFEYFFVRRNQGKDFKIVRVLAPSRDRADTIVARHFGLKSSITRPESILSYLDEKRIKLAQIDNVFDPDHPQHLLAPLSPYNRFE